MIVFRTPLAIPSGAVLALLLPLTLAQSACGGAQQPTGPVGYTPAAGSESTAAAPEPEGAGPGTPDGGDAAPTAKPTAASTASAPEPPKPPPPEVEITEPEFVGAGTIPKVDSILDKTRADVAQCVADHGGLSGETGDLHVQFLVTVRSRAEGVEVLKAKGMGKEAAACVRRLLKGKWVGAPTADPTGVNFHYELKRAAGSGAE